MIHRTVLLKLNDNVDAQTIVAEARRILPLVPGVLSAAAGIPADDTSVAWDLYLHITFAHLADVPPYVVHPVHQDFLRTWLAPNVAVKRVWNFRV